MKPLPQMTPDEKRIAVAEFEGYYPNEFTYPGGVLQGVITCGDDAAASVVPDYLNDLDAIAKVCGKLLFSKRRPAAHHRNGTVVKSKPLKLYLCLDRIIVAASVKDAKKVQREEGGNVYPVKRLTGKVEVTPDDGSTTSNMNAAYLARLWGRGFAPEL